MKKITLSMLLLLLIASTSNAQFRAGIKAGGNLSNLTMNMQGVEFEIYNPRIGFNAGLMAEYMFSQHFGLHTELMCVNNGANIDPDKYIEGVENPEGVSVEGYVDMHTFQMPLYLKTKLILPSNIKLYAMAGAFATLTPYGDQHMKMKAEGESLKVKWSIFDPKIQVMDEVETNYYMQRNFNMGAAVEAGIEMDRLIVGVGFRKVLTNMSGIEILGVGKPIIKMWMANLSLGYYF